MENKNQKVVKNNNSGGRVTETQIKFSSWIEDILRELNSANRVISLQISRIENIKRKMSEELREVE